MVFVQKTYSGARRLWSKVLTVMLVAVGFFAILFNTRSSVPGLSTGMHETGIAHADAPTCEVYTCTDASDTDCGPGDSGS